MSIDIAEAQARLHLTNRIAILEAQRDDLQRTLDHSATHRALRAFAAENAALKADLDRLHDALLCVASHTCMHCREIARAALNPTKEESVET